VESIEENQRFIDSFFVGLLQSINQQSIAAMKRSIATICTAAACLSCNSNSAEAFTTPSRRIQQTPFRIQTKLNLLHLPIETLHSTSNYISTISADIDNIPDDEFGKVFAGGGIVMLGSVISTMIVGALVESGEGGYADLVAETYAEQDLSDEGKETFLNSLGLVSLFVVFVCYCSICNLFDIVIREILFLLTSAQLYFALIWIYFGIY